MIGQKEVTTGLPSHFYSNLRQALGFKQWWENQVPKAAFKAPSMPNVLAGFPVFTLGCRLWVLLSLHGSYGSDHKTLEDEPHLDPWLPHPPSKSRMTDRRAMKNSVR